MPLEVGLPLESLKKAQKDQITSARDAAEQGPFTYNGMPFTTGEKDQIKIIGNVVAVQAGHITDGVFMIDADDVERQFSATDYTAFAMAVFAHIQRIYTTASRLRNQIDQASTPADVRAIQWPTEPIT